MKRYIALDYGGKRIGVAVSDPMGSMALPRDFIPNDKSFLLTLKEMLKEDDIADVVIGLPVQMDGQDSVTTTRVRKIGMQIEKQLKVAVHFQDERLSTQAVERELIGFDVSRKKRKTLVDSGAAAFILQSFLDKLRA